MSALPAVKSNRELYPLTRDESTRAIVQAVLAWDRTADNKPRLFRALTEDERNALQARYKVLNDNLHHAKPSDVTVRIAMMIIGFSQVKPSEKEAKVIATQYAKVLGKLPMWAIDRAVAKFEGGYVTVEQMEGVNRAFYPSTAQLNAVAEQLVGEFYQEQRNVYMALHGQVEHQPSPEERARVKQKFKDLADTIKTINPEPERQYWYDKPLDMEAINADLQAQYGRKEVSVEE